METTVDIVGNKWKPIIFHHLSNGKKRFNELKRLIPGITHQVLSQHLRQLEDQGIIHREVYPESPPKVEYSLTETGLSLLPVLMAMHDWGVKYLNGEFQRVMKD